MIILIIYLVGMPISLITCLVINRINKLASNPPSFLETIDVIEQFDEFSIVIYFFWPLVLVVLIVFLTYTLLGRAIEIIIKTILRRLQLRKAIKSGLPNDKNIHNKTI